MTKKTEKQLRNEFEKNAMYIPLNKNEGYYTIYGLKSNDTLKLFEMFCKSKRKK